MLVLILLVVFNYNSVPENVDQAVVTESNSEVQNDEMMNTSVEDVSSVELKNPVLVFTGFGPAGKTEVINFSNIKYGDISLNENDSPVSGKIEVDLKSVNSGKTALDTHLCNEDFFECETYPNAIFNLKSVDTLSETEYSVTGDLTFKDITKSITFDVDKNGDVYSSEFLLNVRNFNIGYMGINDNVQVNLSFGIK